MDQEKSKASLLTAYEGVTARERWPAARHSRTRLDRDDQGGRQLLHISCRGGFSRSKQEPVGINENGLAMLEYESVESGKQREGAEALFVVGRRPASRLREPELCTSFLLSRSVS